jgi:IS5 family transposase
MKQTTLAFTEFELIIKRTCKSEFLEEMNLVVPWTELTGLIEPFALASKTVRPPFSISTMLRIHFMQQWFGLSDPATEGALHDMALFREFAQLDAGASRLPDESTILRFRHLLEANNLATHNLATENAKLIDRGLLLKAGIVVDATLIEAPSSTNNSLCEREPEMHQTKKGNQWHFGIKAHIGADVESGLVHMVTGTAANEHDITQAHALLHGEEDVVLADSGYRGITKRQVIKTQNPGVDWQVAKTHVKRRALKKSKTVDALIEKLEKIKASIRAKVEHPFRVIKCQFGYPKTRYRGLVKNTAQLITLFVLSNLWMMRKRIIHVACGMSTTAAWANA